MATVTESQRALGDFRAERRAVRQRLAHVRWRIRVHLALAGLAWTCGTALVVAAASLALDWLLRFHLPVRIVLMTIGIAALIVVAYRRLVRPVVLKLDDLDLAVVVDRRRPGVGQWVANVLQLPDLVAGRVQASPSMVRTAVLEQSERLARTDLSGILDYGKRRWLAMALAACVAFPTVFSFAAPQIARLWAKRWLAGSNVRWPQSTYLSIVGLEDHSRLFVPRGETLLVQVDSQPAFVPSDSGWRLMGRGEPLVVETAARPDSRIPEQVTIRYAAVGGATRHGIFTRYEGGRFRYELPPIHEPVEFTLTGGDDWLGPIRVEPLDRPTIESLSIAARQPAYGIDATYNYETLEGQLLFLPDTELTLNLTASVPLESARLEAKDGPPPVLEMRDERRSVAHWRMKEPLSLEIVLVARDGGLASRPHYLSIGLLTDRPPRVTARASGVGRRVTPQVQIPLTVRALDDFAVTTIGAELEETRLDQEKPVSSTHAIAVALPEGFEAAGPVTDLERQPTIQFAPFALIPGTTVKLRGTAKDNCAEGSQSGESRWLTFQVVTPEELFYEILMRQREQRARFAAALEAAKKQGEALNTLVDAEQTLGVVRANQLITRQVWQIANALDAALQETTLNDLGSPQARELLATAIIAPMRRVHDEPMANLRGVLDTLASQETPADAELTQARALQGKIVTAMEQILKQMAQWESFVDVLNQVRQIINLQHRVLETTEQMQKSRTQELFDD
jgi:hypothetical protein